MTSPTNKSYFGQTVCAKQRERQYKYGWCKGQPKIYAAIKKYGFEQMNFTILHQNLSKKDADILEERYIVDNNTIECGYNCKPGGSACALSEETKKKLSDAHKGKIISAETRKKISSSLKGKVVLSDSHRQKLLEANKGKIYSDEMKLKFSIANMGKKHHPATIQKLKQAHTGRKQTEETKLKRSAALRNRPQSQESNIKRSIAMTKYYSLQRNKHK